MNSPSQRIATELEEELTHQRCPEDHAGVLIQCSMTLGDWLEILKVLRAQQDGPSERYESKPCAWLIERGDGRKEIIPTPLTDATFLDYGDTATPLHAAAWKEDGTQEALRREELRHQWFLDHQPQPEAGADGPTPRVDAAQFDRLGGYNGIPKVVSAEFARELERDGNYWAGQAMELGHPPSPGHRCKVCGEMKPVELVLKRPDATPET